MTFKENKLNNIVLIGMMGSGKTSIGKELVNKLKESNFIDLDELIENKFGKTIPDIFMNLGEEEFRKAEKEILKDLLKQGVSNQVISTGGGIILQEENQEILKSLGKVFWLKASLNTIHSRIENDDSRPLLADKSLNKKEKIRMLIDAREIKYQNSADHIIQVDNKDLATICEEIINFSSNP